MKSFELAPHVWGLLNLLLIYENFGISSPRMKTFESAPHLWKIWNQLPISPYMKTFESAPHV